MITKLLLARFTISKNSFGLTDLPITDQPRDGRTNPLKMRNRKRKGGGEGEGEGKGDRGERKRGRERENVFHRRYLRLPEENLLEICESYSRIPANETDGIMDKIRQAFNETSLLLQVSAMILTLHQRVSTVCPVTADPLIYTLEKARSYR